MPSAADRGRTSSAAESEPQLHGGRRSAFGVRLPFLTQTLSKLHKRIHTPYLYYHRCRRGFSADGMHHITEPIFDTIRPTGVGSPHADQQRIPANTNGGNNLIYLVEDDSSIRELIVYTLNSQGMAAEGFPTPSRFYAALEQTLPDLILLDIMLPEEDGLSMLKKLRQSPRTADLPIIMLTAKGTEYDKVIALDAGADDYVAKPFGMMELMARIRARLRRTSPQPLETLQCGGLSVDPARHEVRADGESVTLTQKEFELLCLLLESRGIVLTRAQLLDRIWGYAFDGESRTVDVHIRTLRQKLGTCGGLIETVRGYGYRIAASEDV